jgi:multiple sugar transport system permease protein
MLGRKLEPNQAVVALQPNMLNSRALIRRRKLRDIAGAYLFLAPNMLGFLVFVLFPLVAAFVISLFDWSLLTSPTFLGLGNYARLLTQDPVFHRILFNTLYFVFGYVPLNIVISLGLAVWLSGRIRAKSLFRIIFFFPVMTPGVAVSLVWLLMYDPSGVINWFLSLVGIHGPNWVGSATWAMPAVILMSLWYGVGYNMLVFSAGLQAIPGNFYEAASIDGATRLHQFWNITIPLLSPSIFFGLVMTLITSFQVFDQVFILTGGGPGASTTTLVLYTFQNGFSYFRMGYAASVSTVLFLLIMAVTIGQFILQKRWVHYEV